MSSKKERAAEKAQCAEYLKESLDECADGGKASAFVSWVGGGPTPYGRTDYYEVRCMRTGDNGAPEPWVNLTYNLAKATGYRFNEARGAVSIGGCGYSKTQEIAQSLADIAGKPIRVYSDSGMFSGGMVQPRRRAS